jgi:hypothetical protein
LPTNDICQVWFFHANTNWLNMDERRAVSIGEKMKVLVRLCSQFKV